MTLRQNSGHSSEINVSFCIPFRTYLHLHSVQSPILDLNVSLNLKYLSIPKLLQNLMTFDF